jgi:hypothetical protein
MKTQRSAEQGVALITTMIVVAVLAVVAVAFMQSTSTDRLSSRTAVNYVQARLVAEAGAAAGGALVVDAVKRYPDSVTVWQNIGGGAANGTNNEATVLYVRAQVSDTKLGARPAQFGNEVTNLAIPLVSRTNTDPVPLASVSSNLPFAAGNPNMVNLNATNAGRPRPFIGSRSMTNAGPPVTAAQWVYMGARPGPTNATNPAIARYAFWVEDESFKVNVNAVTNGARLATSLGLAPTDLRLDGSWGSSSNSILRGANFAEVISARNQLAGGNFPTALTTALAASITDSEATDELKFLTTVHSAGLDLSRGGFKRFNLNAATNGDKRAGLDRLIAAITNTNAAPDFGQRFYRSGANAGQTTNFFVTDEDALIYLQKIAANVYDYLDNDDQPTIINNNTNFTLRTGPTNAGIGPLGSPAGPNIEGTNSVAAVGVENLPRLQEYAIHARLLEMRYNASEADSFGFSSTNAALVPKPTSATFKIWIDHYFEFWNPGTRDITLSNAAIDIVDQPAFSGVTGPLGAERDITNIPVGNITFPAGGLVVMTTARFGEESLGSVSSNNLLTNPNVVYLPVNDADRKFEGSTSRFATNSSGQFLRYANSGPSAPSSVQGYDRLFEVAVTAAASAGIIITNSSGLLDSFYGLTWSPVDLGWPLSVSNGYVRDAFGSLAAGNNDNLRASSLQGNWSRNGSPLPGPNASEGDPRTLNEQLEFKFQNAPDLRTSFYMTLVTGVPGQAGGPTFGVPNTNYIATASVAGQTLSLTWTDVSGFSAGASNAPLFVRNGAMQSIGELGHITDPARTRGGVNERFVRGGSRTLRVGQPEIGPNSMPSNPVVWWYAGNQVNAARSWTSWRLADIFTTTAASNNATTTNAQGIRTNSLGVVRGGTNTNGVVVTIPGLINPNGALRDGGAAMRAALFGLAGESSPVATNASPDVSPQGARAMAGQSLLISNVATNIVLRLTNLAGTGLPANSLNPFWERGEISELRVFNTGTNLVSSLNMSNVFDRGREEVVRRSIEMITTRGSVFSVYAIGETLQGTNVTGTARLKQTFEIIPQFPTADAFNDNFALNATRISRRFAPPANYTVRVLATSYD